MAARKEVKKRSLNSTLVTKHWSAPTDRPTDRKEGRSCVLYKHTHTLKVAAERPIIYDEAPLKIKLHLFTQKAMLYDYGTSRPAPQSTCSNGTSLSIM